MVETSFWIRFVIGGFLYWVGIYLVSRNIRSKTAWVVFLFLFSLGWYIIAVDALTPLFSDNLVASKLLYQLTNWSYILPIPLLFHLALLVTQSKEGRLWVQLKIIYIATIALIILSNTTPLVIDYNNLLALDDRFGVFYGRGPLFNLIAVVVIWAVGAALYCYAKARAKETDPRKRMKFLLPAISSILYLIVGPFLVYIYQTDNYTLAVYGTAPLLIAPFLPIAVAIFFYGLISDIEKLFNIKEFVYLTIAIALINIIPGTLFTIFIAPKVSSTSQIFSVIFMFLYIFTHAFYDWLTTFIRDLLYNAGRGFSLITDTEVNDLVRNFHTPEKIEASSIVRFKSVKHRAEHGQLVDAAQHLIREAIEYFKQSDFPRRTKQNIKYQILKMLTVDESEEGQILWELGFDGYPMKILTGEDSTRKPLFKVESMSDYTAISRNAFIALKKEAVHDLAWRLSYLERTAH